MIGTIHNKWTIIDGPFKNGPHQEWLCCCKCGIEKKIRKQHLLSGASKGCISCRDEFGYRTVGVSKIVFDKLTRVADHAIDRCTNTANERYHDYGGRGIQVKFADRKEFIKYLITIPGHDNPSLIVDRINNDGHYEEGNIRFVTHSNSIKNRRSLFSEQRYFMDYGFSKVFKRLHDKGVSFRRIAELYCVSDRMICECVQETN